MRSVNSAFSVAIAEKTLNVAELYIVELANGDIFYYTSHQQDITWDSANNIYIALPIQRTAIRYTSNLQSSVCTLTLANITGDLYNIVMLNALETAKVTIKRVLYTDTYAADKEIPLFVGIADIEFNRAVLIMKLRPDFDKLGVNIPRRLYEEPCNSQFGDYACTLNYEDYEYQGTATNGSRTTVVDTTLGQVYKIAFDGGDSSNPIEIGDALVGGVAGDGVCLNIIYLTSSTGYLWYGESTVQFVNDEVVTGGGNTVTANGASSSDDTYFELGEIQMTSGNSSGERRPILSHVGSTGIFTVFWPFTNTIIATDTYNAYPSCNKTADHCDNKFNNADNFGGFIHIPKVEETLG